MSKKSENNTSKNTILRDMSGIPFSKEDNVLPPIFKKMNSIKEKDEKPSEFYSRTRDIINNEIADV